MTSRTNTTVCKASQHKILTQLRFNYSIEDKVPQILLSVKYDRPNHPSTKGIYSVVIAITMSYDFYAIASTIYLLKAIAITASRDLWGDRNNNLYVKAITVLP